MKKNAKALSPVVASIILIAVTVAVSVAVAAWMGGMTIGFMGSSEEVKISTIAFSATGTDNDNVTITVKNSGTAAVTIEEVWINNVEQTSISLNATSGTDLPVTIPANGQTTISVHPYSWTAGDNYQVKVVTAQGNSFMKNAIPPS